MGIKLAAEEVNAAGGVLGRKIELVLEDSVNPQTGSAKAERLIERDKVAMIIGEISSATALAIARWRTGRRPCHQHGRELGPLDRGVELITKPFAYADLAARVRDVLDNKNG